MFIMWAVWTCTMRSQAEPKGVLQALQWRYLEFLESSEDFRFWFDLLQFKLRQVESEREIAWMHYYSLRRCIISGSGAQSLRLSSQLSRPKFKFWSLISPWFSLFISFDAIVRSKLGGGEKLKFGNEFRFRMRTLQQPINNWGRHREQKREHDQVQTRVSHRPHWNARAFQKSFNGECGCQPWFRP